MAKMFSFRRDWRYLTSILRGAVSSLCQEGDDIALDVNITDKLRELPPIFSAAQVMIKIATDFDSEFFDKQIVKDTIEEALEKGVKIKVLSEGEPPEWYKKQGQIEIRRVDSLPYHLMVIDDCHVRTERPHKPFEFGKKEDDVALIFKGFPETARRYEGTFDRLWDKASSKT
jgi:sugar-specific transcriptional regulator TrmB